MVAPPSSSPAPPVTRSCSWCGKPDGQVKLVAGPVANICEACVRLACAVLGIQIVPEGTEPEAGKPAKPND